MTLSKWFLWLTWLSILNLYQTVYLSSSQEPSQCLFNIQAQFYTNPSFCSHNTFSLSSRCILLFCCVVCDVWVTVSVYRVITAVGRGWTGWIFTMTILSFMLQVGLHALPLPAYHDTPAANNTRVTHSHILAKYPLHRNKTESFVYYWRGL